MININRLQFKIIIFTIVMICTIAQSSSQAASFDCSKASKPIEKEICRDKNLSELDEKLAQLFSASIKQLSPSAHKRLTNSQTKWVEYYSAYCKNDDDKSKKISSAMDSKCLANAYSERIKDLKATGKEIYGYKTYRVFGGAVRFTKDYLGGSPNPMNATITMAIYPQIDDNSPSPIRLMPFCRDQLERLLPKTKTQIYLDQSNSSAPLISLQMTGSL